MQCKVGKKKEIVLFAVGLVSLFLWPGKSARADEIAELREQSLQLQQRLDRLEVGQTLKESSLTQKIEEVAGRQKEVGLGPADSRVFWKEGLRYETTDGNFKLRFGGRIMHDWLWISEEDDIKADVGEQEQGSEFRWIRLYTSGHIYDGAQFKLQIDFAGGDADLKDAYLGLTNFPIVRLRIGHFKEPFSLEELTSSKNITFLERALPNVFAPSRNAGFMLYGTALASLEPRMSWAVGIFSNTDNNGQIQDGGGYNFTGRLTYLPWYKEGGASFLHIGVAYSHQNPDGTARFRARPEAHLTDRFADTGAFGSDKIDLVGLEGAWVHGPLSIQGEYMFSNVDAASSADFDGYYIQASYFLTGEHRNYKTSTGAFSRIKPERDFSFKTGGSGAWEIAARYSSVDLSSGSITGGELENITVGLNWYLNPHIRIMWNYVHADKEDVGKADMALMRLQIDF